MPRILLSLALIAVTAGALIGGTGAFFGDTETSAANVFTAGAIDLKIDNESYYNLNKCTEITPDVWQWQGTASYPVVGTPCTTSWTLDDLDNGHLFFDFTDVKPDDEGEDTISLHVQNDAWACMNLSLTANDDTSSNEPELEAGDLPEDTENDWDGELAQAIQMFWWADDGDNVYEAGELSISGGVKTLIDLGYTDGPFTVAIADTANNAWGTPGPLPANETVYLAKAWCFGTLAPTPLADDADTGPQVRGTGFACNGTALGNLTQTDTATLDIQFSAVQARHNPDFLCTPREEPTTGTLTVVKVIDGGDATADDFSFTVNADPETPFDVSGTNVLVLTPGQYDVVESTIVPDYTPSYANSENANANCTDLTVVAGQNVTCTITNTAGDIPVEIITLIDEDFGTGDCLQDIPGWDEDPGESCVNGTVAAAIGTGDNTVSPDGGRFALIGNDGYICKSIDATNLENLSISYYWRGDNDADAGENGLVQYATGGTCAAPTGLVDLAAHPLTTLTWQSNTEPLPASLNGTTFFVRFAADTSAGTESFRVDGLSLTATAI